MVPDGAPGTTVVGPTRKEPDVPWRSSPAVTTARHPLPQARPPQANRLGSWRVEATGDLRRLRAQLQDTLRAPRHLASPVLLVASELATNALRYGVPPVVVTLGHADGTHVLDVADGSVDAVPIYSAYRPAGEGGFGLYLIGRLASEVGWYVEDGRKHVWATIARRADGDRSSRPA